LNIFSSHRKRGIVLVTVLFLTILISMFIGAAILVGPRTLGLAGSQDGELTAQAAAESGIQYAIMRVRQNPEWRAESGGVVLSTDDLVVVENEGYVWGHMKAPDGSGSLFRIRFNFENGDDGGDNLSNSSGQKFATSYVSLNNLSNSSEAIVPRASSDSQSVVTDPSVGTFVVPAHGLCLVVEGLAGPGVREFDPANPNPQGLTYSKISEGIFTVLNFGEIATDAVAMSNSDLLANLEDGQKVTVETKGGGTPRIRSRGNVNVEYQDGSPGKYESEGTVYTKDATLNADYDASKVTVETEQNSDPFYELGWDDLKKADPSGPKLSAGTYVWWDDGSLHYYDMDYETYAEWVRTPLNTNNPGQVIYANGSYTGSFSPPATLEITEGKIKLKGDIYVDPVLDGTGAVKASDLAIIPREGAPEEPAPDPTAPGGGATAAGPALAEYLANNAVARQAFFAGRYGDGSSIPHNINPADQGWDSYPGSGSGADIGWRNDGSAIYYDPQDYSSLQAALEDAFDDGFVTPGELTSTAATYGLIGAEGDLDLNTGDTTKAEDLDVEFAPPDGESATLSAEGNIRIGAKLKGKGASITAGETLTVVGAGADLAATPNAEEGVNMYARGDITLSTLKEKDDGTYEFKDIKLKGLVYTWGDFIAKLGSDDPDVSWGKMELEGTLVAFGGDPENGTPTTTDSGKVDLTAKEVKLKFDPAYLLGVMQTLPENIQFTRASWTSYR